MEAPEALDEDITVITLPSDEDWDKLIKDLSKEEKTEAGKAEWSLLEVILEDDTKKTIGDILKDIETILENSESETTSTQTEDSDE